MTQHRKLAAIVSADVAGYSRLMGEDEQATLETLTVHRHLIADRVIEHGGRVVDSPGDALLAEFPSALEAVRAAVEIQRELYARNAMRPENRRMTWRIGINLGDVIEENGALYGDGVNIAARLQAISEPSGVCVSGTVFDQVDGKLPLKLNFAGEQAVKNIAKPVRAYHVILDEARAAVTSSRSSPPAGRRALVIALGVVVLAVSGVTAWYLTRKPARGAFGAAGAADPIYAMPSGPRVAVLPFVNMSGDAAQEYFSDGLTEDVITELSRFRDLYVLARNTTYQYKGRAVDVPGISRALGVQYVLEGSVRKSGDQVRITAQLIDTQSGAHVWADRYDRGLKDIFVVQGEIATKIAATVAGGWAGSVQRATRERAQSKPPEQLQAYDYVLQATTDQSFNPEGYRKRKAELQKALELDPNYARARREYAWLTLLGWIFSFEKSAVPPREIREHAIRSVELDPADPLAHRTAAFGYYFDKQLGQFEREAQLALELAPNNPEILAQLGFLTAISGQWARGVKLAVKAHDLNAASAAGWYNSTLFYDYYRKGRYREAVEVLKLHPFQGIIETQQKYVAVYSELGDLEKAREHWKRCVELDPAFSAASQRERLRLWNFQEPFIQRYIQSIAKAG